ncbi:ATP-dependent 6-phosphofructokinase [Pectinatus haikarae]|uniref:6-phosphofructokinase n=1 Tax=Pectinatus haikarae TaxID=349096 RepID=A0ABT9Y664_9FIRM|nr:ATP-dependent 6-phosphofructokinase [Pectinatus haikarae]MDQ0203330.1 6-phosphofructokinase 1 [Pectinatus haikarae]
MIKSIAVLTSGTDSPGMNAAIRAVTRAVLFEKKTVWGVNDGFYGLVHDEMNLLKSISVSDTIQRGGTFLGTSFCPEFETTAGRKRAFENLRKHKIDGMIVIGGDGTMKGAKVFSEEFAFPIVGIPATIENDIWGTDYTIGCDTAANTVVEALNKLRDTALSHRRVIVVEVSGKKCGWLPMVSGIASGAEYILVPEYSIDMDGLVKALKKRHTLEKTYSLIVVADGCGDIMKIGREIAEKTHLDTRISVLDLILRGGSPTVEDRVKASRLGEKAALALLSGLYDMVIGYDRNDIVTIDLKDAVANTKELDREYARIARILT